jgi:hypothetical protein
MSIEYKYRSELKPKKIEKGKTAGDSAAKRN